MYCMIDENANVCYFQPTDLIELWQNVLLVMSIDVKQQGIALNECWANCVTLTFTSPMILTFDFQGKILKQLYLRSAKTDWPRMKRMWVDRLLDPLCDPELWPLTSDMQGQILKRPYPRNGMADWHGTKGCESIGSRTTCDFQPWPHPWPWP